MASVDQQSIGYDRFGAELRKSGYHRQGPRSFFRLHEKDERYNVVPAHHTA